jgi:hypothetical protein
MAKREREEEQQEEMTLEEARAWRASLAKETKAELTLEQKREAFRVFWAQAKSAYGKSKDLEDVLWLHLKSIKMDKPEQFEDGLRHFGLKKIR